MSRAVIYGPSLDEIARTVVQEVQHQMEGRAYRAANELRNSALDVLRGQRSGRSYRVPGTKVYYTASAPGEPPAMRTGTFRNSWHPTSYAFGTSYISRIENPQDYADYLENGTPGGQMAPRPHHERIQEHALPEIMRIYDEPYF